jgi:hypothetical protein
VLRGLRFLLSNHSNDGHQANVHNAHVAWPDPASTVEGEEDMREPVEMDDCQLQLQKLLLLLLLQIFRGRVASLPRQQQSTYNGGRLQSCCYSSAADVVSTEATPAVAANAWTRGCSGTSRIHAVAAPTPALS